MTKKSYIKFLGLLLVVGLLFAAAPVGQAQAQGGGNTLYVADWSDPVTLANVTRRSTVLKDSTTYHMWYSNVAETGLYYTSSTDSAAFGAGTPVTFSGGAPVEVGSVSVIKEADGFKMIAYGVDNSEFALYTSADGTAWAKVGTVFDGTGIITDLGKVDAPFLLKLDSGYRLYFQVKNATGTRYDIYAAESSTIGGTYALANGGNPVLSPATDANAWDGAFVMHPWVVKDGDVYYMWYSAHKGGTSLQQIGMAKSTDGLTWVKSPGNPILPQADPYFAVGEPSVINDGGTWRMWYLAAGNVIKYLTATGPFEFQTIQAAIDAAVAGDTINVAPGTYDENITINKAGITLQSTGTAAETIINANEGFGVYILKDLGTVTVDGFTVKGWLTSGIVQGTANRANTTSKILNNIVIGETGDTNHGNGIQVTGDNSLIEGNTVTGAYYIGTGPYGASGILVYAANNVVVRNNTVTGADIGISVAAGAYHSLGPITGVLVEDNEVYGTGVGIQVSFDANNTSIKDNYVHDNLTGLYEEFYLGYGPTGTVALNNRLVDNDEQALTGATDTTPIPGDHIFVAEENWWGSIAGPGETEINDYVDYVPWCGDAACSFLVYPMVGTDLQASINATPVGGTLYVPAGTYSDGGVDGYTVGGKTIILGDGVVIQANSPCFTVTGDNTIITAETIGEAKCAFFNPSGLELGGIEVDAELKNVVIGGIYFEADAAAGNGDILSAIYFDGAIEDVLINDNYFYSTGTGVDPEGYQLLLGIYFAEQPTGYVEIKGNLFDMQKIIGCAVEIGDPGTSTIDAQFNSFGSMAGHPTDRGCATLVDYSNYTHADVYLESSATPWLNQEVVGEPFTLTVKANLTKVTGAKFTLKYNPALVDLVAGSLSNLSGFEAAGPQMFEVDETLGLITFNANVSPAFTGANHPLFSASFTASAVGGALFEVDALSDEFAMFPSYGASSNVYAYTLLPVTVDLIELPTVTSDFGGSYYLVGEERAFTITVTNFDTAYSAPELRLTLPTGLTVTYGGMEYTGTLVIDLADLAVDETVTLDLSAKFTQPYTPTAAVIDAKLVDALTPEEELVATSFSALAYTKATVTVAADPYFIVAEPGAFTVTITNPATGRNYGNSIVFDMVIANHAVADISAISCTMGTQTWDLIGTLTQNGADVKARIGGVDGYFTIPAPLTAAINCSVSFATPGTYAVSGYMVEAIPSPERIVSDAVSDSAIVYAKPTISSANLTGPFQEGVAQAVTINVDSVSAMYTPINSFILHLGLPDGTVVVYGGNTYTCLSTGCDIPVTLAAGANPLAMMITFNDPLNAPVTVALVDTVVEPDRTLATFTTSTNVVVYANVAEVLGTVRMQGRTTRSGVVFTLTGTLGYGPYTATSTNLLTGNVRFTNLASGVYTITVVQARYLDVTISSSKSIDLAVLQALAALELKAGDANDDHTINGGDASIIGTQYGTGTIVSQGDVNFDNAVNIQDLALVGGNFYMSSATAYSSWLQP